jgi:two-component system sensor kinase FixL
MEMDAKSKQGNQQAIGLTLGLSFSAYLIITTTIVDTSLWNPQGLESHSNSTLLLFLGSLLLVTVISIVVTKRVTHEIKKAFNDAITITKQLAGGNFKVSPSPQSSLESEQLISALKEMADELDVKLQAIYSSEAQAKAIIETANDVIITINDCGIITSANPSTIQTFGYQSDQLIGQNINMLMPAPYKSQHDSHLKHHLDTGEKHIIGIGREVVGQHKDGATIPLFLTVSRVNLSDEILFCGVLHDLSREKDNQKQLIQAGKLASLGTLTAGIAHELRQPLAIIRLASENTLALLEDEDEVVTSKEITTTFQQVVNNCDRMNRIVDHLRSFARDDDNQVMETISLTDVLDNSFTLLNAQLSSHGIDVTTNIAEGVPAIRGNAHQLEQILINLLSNARDALATVKEPIINIGIQPSGKTVTLTLEDNGPGVPLEAQSKIFDPFFTTKEIGKGTGLGLSISHGIISDHGGTISYSERSGGGATFTLTLPIAITE